MSASTRFREHHLPAPREIGDVLVEANDVSVALGAAEIVADVSFSVRAGEIVAIIGPNGAGKSTLLGAIAGDYGYSGSIRIDGREVSDWSQRDLALRRAVLRQSNAISFPFTTLDVVKMGRAPWKHVTSVAEDDRIIAQELLRTDTFQFAERRFTSMSGGERARVSLARALAQRTGVLLLDEPTAALDVNYQEQVLALARRYARQGNAVIVVLHDLGAAAAYADRVLMLVEGRPRAWGEPDTVLTAETISDVYQHPVRVIREASGELLIVPVRFADEPVAAPGAVPAVATQPSNKENA